MLIHFIGIGGIGVSALAKYHMLQDARVSGSDLAASEITAELLDLGAAVKIGKHAKKNLSQETERVIHTAAVPAVNPELKEAKIRKIPTHTYAQAVGELTRRYQTITVSGTHGKSTTTALIALVLTEGYFDPTVIVGTKLKEFGNSNFRRGLGSHLVLEADEWNKTFLNFSPKIAVVTNIDAEHLDTYKTVDGIEKTFSEYLGRVPKDGAIVANADDERLAKIAKKFRKKVKWYSIRDKEARIIRSLLRLPGEHNVSNALAALAVGRTLGIAEPDILRAMARFSGSWRRFEFLGMLDKAVLLSDYGHHPREIRATLAAARERYPFRRVWCVYQPHQYRRLAYLWDDFVTAFDMADRVCLLPVYDVAGRETIKAKNAVSSLKLAKLLDRRGKTVCHLKSLKNAEDLIRSGTRPGDVVLIMGAGDIYNLTKKLI